MAIGSMIRAGSIQVKKNHDNIISILYKHRNRSSFEACVEEGAIRKESSLKIEINIQLEISGYIITSLKREKNTCVRLYRNFTNGIIDIEVCLQLP